MLAGTGGVSVGVAVEEISTVGGGRSSDWRLYVVVLSSEDWTLTSTLVLQSRRMMGGCCGANIPT